MRVSLCLIITVLASCGDNNPSNTDPEQAVEIHSLSFNQDLLIDLSGEENFVFDQRLVGFTFSYIEIICPNGQHMKMDNWLRAQQEPWADEILSGQLAIFALGTNSLEYGTMLSIAENHVATGSPNTSLIVSCETAAQAQSGSCSAPESIQESEQDTPCAPEWSCYTCSDGATICYDDNNCMSAVTFAGPTASGNTPDVGSGSTGSSGGGPSGGDSGGSSESDSGSQGSAGTGNQAPPSDPPRW